jgi:hypothetical protein
VCEPTAGPLSLIPHTDILALPLSQLITMREVVSKEIRQLLVQRAMTFNIVLDDVSITALTFGKEYTAAIEAKQVAQQDAERAKFVVSKAIQVLAPFSHRLSYCTSHWVSLPASPTAPPTASLSPPILLHLPRCLPPSLSLTRQSPRLSLQDKKSAIIRAEGEATSAILIGDAIQANPAFLSLRKIEAAREISNTIASSQNRVFLNTDALLLDVTGPQTNPVNNTK